EGKGGEDGLGKREMGGIPSGYDQPVLREQPDRRGRADGAHRMGRQLRTARHGQTPLRPGQYLPAQPQHRPVRLRPRAGAAGGATLHGPKAHATISGNSSRQTPPPCAPARSVMTTSAPASRSAPAHRAAFSRKNGSSVPATRYARGTGRGITAGGR